MVRIVVRNTLSSMLVLVGFSGTTALTTKAMDLPASDPVGIARSGAGVAYGNNLEAASINPSIVASLRDPVSMFVATGIKKQSDQVTLQSHDSRTFFSKHNTRFPVAIGFAWRPNDKLGFGLKFDEPFLTNIEMPLPYPGQHLGNAFCIDVKRLEAQLAWAVSPNLAVGISSGLVKTSLDWQGYKDLQDPEAKDVNGIEKSFKTITPSYALGFRWAINPVWTIGGSYVSSIKSSGSTNNSKASLTPTCNKLVLPDKATIGIRQRVNPFFTWEFDARYVLDSKARYWPRQLKCSSSALERLPKFNNHFGFSFTSELTMSRDLVLRLGSSFDKASMSNSNINPLLNGSPKACFSLGFGYKVFGGELNMGYQFRQLRDTDTDNLHAILIDNKYTKSKTLTRVEGMGHILSVGFKKVI